MPDGDVEIKSESTLGFWRKSYFKEEKGIVYGYVMFLLSWNQSSQRCSLSLSLPLAVLLC